MNPPAYYMKAAIGSGVFFILVILNLIGMVLCMSHSRTSMTRQVAQLYEDMTARPLQHYNSAPPNPSVYEVMFGYEAMRPKGTVADVESAAVKKGKETHDALRRAHQLVVGKEQNDIYSAQPGHEATYGNSVPIPASHAVNTAMLRGMQLDEALLAGRPRAAQPQANAAAFFSGPATTGNGTTDEACERKQITKNLFKTFESQN
jgi:hypothetical protein